MEMIESEEFRLKNKMEIVEGEEYRFEDFPIDISCLSERGDQYESSKKIVEEINLEVHDQSFLKEYLKEFGAWSVEELDDHKENLIRLIWIISCSINDEGYFIYSH